MIQVEVTFSDILLEEIFTSSVVDILRPAAEQVADMFKEKNLPNTLTIVFTDELNNVVKIWDI